MIKLEVEDYCQNCMHFEPEVETIYATAAMVTQTTIRCEHRGICAHVRRVTLHEMGKKRKNEKEKEND